MELNVQDIIESLQDLADPKRIAFARSSYPTTMKILGVVSANEKLVLSEKKKF